MSLFSAFFFRNDPNAEPTQDFSATDFTEAVQTYIPAEYSLAFKNADNIYVLDKGNIVESGSHKDLMMYNGKYAQLVNHQNNLESIYNENLTQKEVAISE